MDLKKWILLHFDPFHEASVTPDKSKNGVDGPH
jgi:hypothetical protein